MPVISLSSFLLREVLWKKNIRIDFVLLTIHTSSTFNHQVSTLLLHIKHSGKDPHYFLIAKFNGLLLISTLFYLYAVFVMLTAVPTFTATSSCFPSAVPIFFILFILELQCIPEMLYFPVVSPFLFS